jgi:hypothetical protein
MPEWYLVRYSGATGAQTSDAHEGEPRMNNHTSASFVPSMSPGKVQQGGRRRLAVTERY